MSFAIIDNKGQAWDVATNSGLMELHDAAQQLTETHRFLEAGEADEAQVKAIIEETTGTPIAKLGEILRQCQAPVTLSDGVAEDSDEEPEETPSPEPTEASAATQGWPENRPVTAGAPEGHEFYGNQYTNGGGGGSEEPPMPATYHDPVYGIPIERPSKKLVDQLALSLPGYSPRDTTVDKKEMADDPLIKFITNRGRYRSISNPDSSYYKDNRNFGEQKRDVSLAKLVKEGAAQQVVVGYALGPDDKWHKHNWAIANDDEGKMIEVLPQFHKSGRYYGARLDAQQSKEWADRVLDNPDTDTRSTNELSDKQRQLAEARTKTRVPITEPIVGRPLTKEEIMRRPELTHEEATATMYARLQGGAHSRNRVQAMAGIREGLRPFHGATLKRLARNVRSIKVVHPSDMPPPAKSGDYAGVQYIAYYSPTKKAVVTSDTGSDTFAHEFAHGVDRVTDASAIKGGTWNYVYSSRKDFKEAWEKDVKNRRAEVVTDATGYKSERMPRMLRGYAATNTAEGFAVAVEEAHQNGKASLREKAPHIHDLLTKWKII